MEPRIAFIQSFSIIHRVKSPVWEDRAWKVFVEKELEKYPNSHPDFGYTLETWEKVKYERKEEWKRISILLDNLRSFTPPEDYPQAQLPIERQKEVKEGYCPKCGSSRVQTVAYRKEGTYYLCLDCDYKYMVNRKEETKSLHWWK